MITQVVNSCALKISFFTCFGFPQGTYFRWHNLAIGLKQLGHDVTVHAIGSAHGGCTQCEVRDGIRYVLVPLTPFVHRLLDSRLDPITLLRAIRHAPEPADIYHIFQPFPHSCLPALFHRRNARCLLFDWDDFWWPGLSIAKGDFLWRGRWLPRMVNFLEQKMPSVADAVTTCSGFLAEEALKRGAITTQVIHNGYWANQIHPSKRAAREKLGLDPQAFYFGFMGRTLGEIDWCLDALSASPSPGRTVRLALCGMPPALIETLSANSRASIDCLGNLTPEETKIFARAIDCGLLPLEDTPFNQSRFPIKFAEYLAGEAHVVASAVGEFARIAPHVPGVILAGITRKEWRNTLVALNWEQLSVPFSSDSKSMLAQKMDWHVLATQLQDYYLACLREKVSPPSVSNREV